MIIPNLKIVRLNNELTQRDVAEILDITPATYGMNEIGKDTITLNNLVKLCDYYNISVNYMLGLSSIERYENYKMGIDKEALAVRLKETRKERGLTQTMVASMLNTDHSVWCRYELGITTITTTFLYAYCKTYQISADYLLGKINKLK